MRTLLTVLVGIVGFVAWWAFGWAHGHGILSDGEVSLITVILVALGLGIRWIIIRRRPVPAGHVPLQGKERSEVNWPQRRALNPRAPQRRASARRIRSRRHHIADSN
jgi:hypothetical protein